MTPRERRAATRAIDRRMARQACHLHLLWIRYAAAGGKDYGDAGPCDPLYDARWARQHARMAALL